MIVYNSLRRTPMIGLLVMLVVVGVVLYLINTYVPMQAPFKTIVNIVVVLFVCIWLLRLAGLVNIPLR